MLMDAFAAARRGDLEAWRVAVHEASGDSAAARAWRIAGELMLETADEPGLSPRAGLARLGALSSSGSERGVVLAAGLVARAGALSADAALVSAATELISHEHAAAHPDAWALAARMWSCFASGEWPAMRDIAGAVARAASAPDASELRVEATALRAWAELELGDADSAVQSARTAARMGRTEAYPQAEYLAAIVLARVRRHLGKSFLAAHILGSLRRYASAPWRAWIDWELAMACGGLEGEAPEGSAAEGLAATLSAARHGEAIGFRRELHRLAARAVAWPAVRSDVHRIEVACCDGAPPAEAAFAQWRDGVQSGPPPGVGASGRALQDRPAGALRVHSSGECHRIPGLAIALARAEGSIVVPGVRSHERVDTLIAVVAMAGAAGVEQDDAFERVYGFAYDSVLHGGRFGVLIHRARDRLAGRATLERDQGRLQFVPGSESLVLPDPRCTLHAGDRVLRALASRSGASARELSRELTIPLRTVQAALRELVEQGLCRGHKRGRDQQYRVEDTTFREPTGIGHRRE